MAEQYLTVMAASKYLGVSREKLSRLIRTGKLSPITNELDSRERLIPKSQLDALKPAGQIVSQIMEKVQENLVEPAKNQARNLIWLFANHGKEANVMETTAEAPVKYHCSFCGKADKDVFRMVAGPNKVYICDECVRLCNQIIDEEKTKTEPEAKPE